ncbi:hypothetical protein JKF63_03720 [Porcisia hertigi]|uniref:Uncharacterized protein n=1 Tax=Porcisia hertigi TaxID=2761500 RepID=A0A836HWV1_9TRYP|nr:hypothetical protein JKF63_03720 [Porcisia hertigi]
MDLTCSPPSATHSSACDCCECGVVVGTESSQRGGLLLPCQHVLHMGCAEFIRRRGKVLMGLDTADFPLHEEEDSHVKVCDADKTAVALRGHRGNSSWVRGANGFRVCPACFTPIARIIPLYLRGTSDTVEPNATDTQPVPSRITAEASATAEAEYRRVYSAQKQALQRLRSLCDQRRRVTELTHACANLHEQRTKYLAEVEKEEQCFPGLTHSVGFDGAEAPIGSSSAMDTKIAGSLTIDHMTVTELELYMAQVTPQLLRTQAELRKERHMIERRTKKLNTLRSHYHSTKELCAFDAVIAQRELRPHSSTAHSKRHSTPVFSAAVQEASSHLSEEAQRRQGPGAPRSSDVASSHVATAAPQRKRHRADTAIDVDDEVLPDVVEVLSCEKSDAGNSDLSTHMTVLDVDDNTASDVEVGDGGTEVGLVPMGDDGSYADESECETPHLIPRYVHLTAASSSISVFAALPKTPTLAVTQHHLRLLPRREDRLWQPSLQF